MRLDRAVVFLLATSEGFERAMKCLPGGRALAWRFASRYVAGRSSADALQVARQLLEQGHGVSVDLFGERVADAAVADRVLAEYLQLAAALPAAPADVWLSVDLSHLGLSTDATAAADRLAQIAGTLPAARRVQVGAEEATQTDAIQGCVLGVAARGLADKLGATLQANLVRSASDLEVLIDAGVHIRLVKGAYLEPTGALAYGEPTDIAFLRLAARLAERGAVWSAATHDGRLREALLLAHGPITVEHLYGVRPEALADLSARAIPTRIYVPYGADWFRYWLRRVAESRGA
jgi:proline dehydrogenase